MESLEVNRVSKKYQLYSGRPVLLKELFLRNKKRTMWSLKDVSFKVNQGETIGIIGENGSGKSTLLKVIAGITSPSSGEVKVGGRLGSLIELGAGFHPDLTGKENLFLNGALMGIGRRELKKRYREIVEFSGIEDYIEQPVRSYSSGMVVRLGFSIAIHIDPEIILVDEVLAVGDGDFQRKCAEKFGEFKKGGKTVVLVSHDMGLVRRMCDKVLWLEKGRVKDFGGTDKVIGRYEGTGGRADRIGRTIKLNPKEGLKFYRVEVSGTNGSEGRLDPRRRITVGIDYRNFLEVKKALFGVAIYDMWGGHLFGESSKPIDVSSGRGRVELVIEKCPIEKGEIYLTLGISSTDTRVRYDWLEKGVKVKIGSSKAGAGQLMFGVRWRTK